MCIMSDKKLAVFFPGIGYTNDKPLLYYSRKLAEERGYEVICMEYHDLPEKIKGNKEKMIQALIPAVIIHWNAAAGKGILRFLAM